MYKKGDIVRLVNPEAVEKFTEGPFTISKSLPHIRAVELDELGTVALSDIVPWDGGSSESTNDDPKTHVETIQQSVVSNSSSRRIESVAGALLSHPDSNVRTAMKEILSLLWRGEE